MTKLKERLRERRERWQRRRGKRLMGFVNNPLKLANSMRLGVVFVKLVLFLNFMHIIFKNH